MQIQKKTIQKMNEEEKNRRGSDEGCVETNIVTGRKSCCTL